MYKVMVRSNGWWLPVCENENLQTAIETAKRELYYCSAFTESKVVDNLGRPVWRSKDLENSKLNKMTG